jgi:hypothetical protein
MSTAVWVSISLLTLAVTSAVALVIAAMHRRQMRQIELHRANPSVPLVPPPHPFTKFLLRNFRHINFALNSALNLTFLTLQVRSTDPLTRIGVLSIAVFTNGLFYTFAMYFMTWGTQQTFEIMDARFDKVYEALREFLNLTGEVTGAMKQQQNYSRLWCSEGFVKRTKDAVLAHR